MVCVNHWPDTAMHQENEGEMYQTEIDHCRLFAVGG